MRWSTAAGVGVAVVVAAAILVAAYVLLASAGVVGNTYTLRVDFDNAQGVTPGTEVRFAGVKIGDVKEVRLSPGNRARLLLRIKQEYTIPLDAVFKLASSGLLTAPVVEIVPQQRGPLEKGVIQGQTSPTLDQLLPEGERLLQNLTRLSGSMQEIVGDPDLRRNLKRSSENIAVVSERGRAIAQNLEAASISGRQVAASFRVTSQRLDRTAAMFQQTLAENRGRLGQTLTTVNDTLGAVQGLVEQLTVLVSDPQVKGSMRGTLANIEQTTENLAKISSSLEKLIGDPKVNEDLRATISTTRATVEDTQRLVQRLNRIVGSGSRTVEGTRERVQKTELTADLGQETSPGRPRVDVNVVVPRSQGRFLRLGLFDLTEASKLNLQLGQPLGRTSLRYGMYASRVGVGLDLGPPSHPRLSLDLYGLDDPRFDVQARTRLRDNMDLNFGVHHLFERNSPFIGLTLRK